MICPSSLPIILRAGCERIDLSASVLQQRLAERSAQRLRLDLQRKLMPPALTGTLDFCSNDYLALRQDAAVRQAFSDAAHQYGLGAGASHVLGGHHVEHDALQAELSEWTNRKVGLLFGSGYQAAIGAMAGLAEKQDFIAADRLIHACMIDGARLSGATLRRFAHNDPESAERILLQKPAQNAALRWLLCESVYSMDGDVAPLSALLKVAENNQAVLVLDEAHGLGVLGPQGAGLAARCGANAAELPVLMLTFGKALGSAGAALMGEHWLQDALINSARAFVYTTAMPPALAAATRTCVRLARYGDARRAKLQENIGQFRAHCEKLGVPVLAQAEPTPIQAIIVGESARALKLRDRLNAAGFLVAAVRPPTVPIGMARLRISLSSGHQSHDIYALVNSLARALEA